MADVSLRLRPPDAQDWDAIAALADRAVEHVPTAPQQGEWARNRRAFTGEQKHFVAVRDDELVGYGAIERGSDQAPGQFRVFIVTDWSRTLDVAQVLYETALAELLHVEASLAWLREYAGDRDLIDFMRERGFEVTNRYELDGAQLVTLARNLEARRSEGPEATRAD